MSTEEPTLVRRLRTPTLTLYGVGVIVGAGIFVLVGEVAREAGDGVGLAFLLAALAALAMYLTGFDRDLSTVVVAALAAITALGAVCGSIIPLALDWAGLDAATVAPPAVTTLIDALGIVIYLTVARAVLDVAPAAHADHAAEAAMAAAAAAATAASNVVEDVVEAAAAAAEAVVEGVGSEL